MATEKRTHMNECYACKHMRTIPGDAHIACINPDPKMRGHEHGLREGWFMYPFNFDPTWKLDSCSKYEAKEDNG